MLLSMLCVQVGPGASVETNHETNSSVPGFFNITFPAGAFALAGTVTISGSHPSPAVIETFSTSALLLGLDGHGSRVATLRVGTQPTKPLPITLDPAGMGIDTATTGEAMLLFLNKWDDELEQLEAWVTTEERVDVTTQGQLTTTLPSWAFSEVNTAVHAITCCNSFLPFSHPLSQVIPNNFQAQFMLARRGSASGWAFRRRTLLADTSQPKSGPLKAFDSAPAVKPFRRPLGAVVHDAAGVRPLEVPSGRTADATQEKCRGMSLMEPIPDTLDKIISPYGMRYHPIKQVYKLHTGIDITCALGDPIKAAHDGQLEVRSNPGGYGHYAIINGGKGWWHSCLIHSTVSRASNHARAQMLTVDSMLPIGLIGSMPLFALRRFGGQHTIWSHAGWQRWNGGNYERGDSR